MARARNIKPGFFKNPELAELDFGTRLLFIGLWTIADREGYLEDRPKRIKMELFPADNFDIESGLAGLEKHGFIKRYMVGESRFMHICKFLEHQHPHHLEKPSTIPKPETSLGLNEAIKAEKPRHDSDKTKFNPSDSLIPDSLIQENTHSLSSTVVAVPPTEGALTPAEVCIAFRNAGIGKVNPSHADLIPLIQAGATLADFVAAGNDAKGKTNPFAYAIATVKGRMSQPTSNGHAHRETFTERRDRERMETLHALTGGRAGQAPTPEKEAVHGTAIRVD